MELTFNYAAIVIAALIPNALGALYYGPLFGNAWQKSMGKTADEMKPNNEAVTYGIALLMGFVISFFLNLVIQFVHAGVDDAGNLIMTSHQTFGHGALHGAFISLFIVTPVIVSLGLFHKAATKTTLLNVVFWITSFALMGGVIDVWR